MKYYSTNRQAPPATLAEAVKKGLAPDKGLYMPERIGHLPEEFFRNIADMDFHEIATAVAEKFFGEDIPSDDLKRIVCDTLCFDTPVVNVHDNIWSLELFHGPTLAFKDVGGRFMARMLSYFIAREDSRKKVTVIVATSGDTGSAVANGFLGVDGIDVIVLYPEGKVSEIQEKQFTTLGKNITALEVGLHGPGPEPDADTDVSQFDKRSPFPPPGFLLFQRLRTTEKSRQSRQCGILCA